MSRLTYLAFGLMLVTFGFLIMGMELLASHLMSPYYGGSIYVWGSIISSFMVHMSIGYILGGLLVRRFSRLTPLLAVLVVASLLTYAIPSLHKPLGEWFSEVLPGERSGSFALMNALFFLPVTLMATVSPYLIGLLNEHHKSGGLSAGLVMFLSTLGSFLGTILTSFFLIDLFRVSRIIEAFGIAGLLCAGLSFGLVRLSLRSSN